MSKYELAKEYRGDGTCDSCGQTGVPVYGCEVDGTESNLCRMCAHDNGYSTPEDHRASG